MRVLFRSPEQWDNARAVLIESAKRLQDAGATALMIAANSMHKLAEDIGAGIAIPLIHIVDETGEKMRADGIKTAAVIGTRNVMTESWYRPRLVRYGLTLAPSDGTRAAEVDRIVYDELMQGKVTEDSRRTMRTFITDIPKSDVQAVVPACTALGMLSDPTATRQPATDP